MRRGGDDESIFPFFLPLSFAVFFLCLPSFSLSRPPLIRPLTNGAYSEHMMPKAAPGPGTVDSVGAAAPAASAAATAVAHPGVKAKHKPKAAGLPFHVGPFGAVHAGAIPPHLFAADEVSCMCVCGRGWGDNMKVHSFSNKNKIKM